MKPLLNAVSRSHERRADSYALKMTENPSAFITAMKRLGQQNLAEDESIKARAGVLLHASADQGTAARGAILGAVGATVPEVQ